MLGGATKSICCAATLLAAAAVILAPAANAGVPRGSVPTHGGGGGTTSARTAAALHADLPPITGALSFHSGYVMHTAEIKAVVWAPGGFNYPSGYVSEIDQFLSDAAADAGAKSNVFASTTQYYDGHTGHITYGMTYDGLLIDTDPYPTNLCNSAYTTGVCLTDAQIASELDTFLAGNHYPSGYANLYPVILPPSVDVCFFASGAQGDFACSTDYFCAYHSWTAPSANPGANPGYIYAVEPYYPIGNANCDPGEHPNNNAADVAVNTLSHETSEAITDPGGAGWWDSAGNEDGDKCAWNFGSRLGTTGSGQYNQVINGDNYFLQREWSNALNGCYQVGPPTIDESQFPTPTAGGETVELYGANFFSASGSVPTVLFNGHASPNVVVDSSSHLTVTVPSVSGTTGHIMVQAVGGKVTSKAVFGLQPTVTSIVAASGFAGTVVTVNGTGFFGVKSVKFGGVAGPFSAVATDGTSLKATVPLAAVDGYVTVTTAGGTSPDAAQFVVLPKISSFTPTSAVAGTWVTINGSGFGSLTDVRFDGDSSPSIDYAHSTATKVLAQVPVDATPGPIVVLVNAGTLASPDSSATFKPLPKITSLDAYDGHVGQTVKIFGSNLTIGPDPVVKFGTVVLPATSLTLVSPTEIDATVPGAPFATGKVTVQTSTGIATSALAFSISKVTSFTPAAAPAGATVTISGQGLASATSVDFSNHAAAPVVSATATAVKVLVPPDAANGALTVNTGHAGGLTTSTLFKPTPRITGFSPADGFAGTTVTLTGTNFYGPADVKFGSFESSGLGVNSPTEITAVVPSGFTSGKISVIEPGGTAASAATFYVTKVTSITPSSAAVSQTITVTGAGLADASSVHFPGGLIATPTNQTATSLKVVVPHGATSGDLSVFTPEGNVQSPGPLTVTFAALDFSPAAATHDHAVTIDGIGLVGASVTINGLACSVTSDTGTQMTVTTPASGDLNGPVVVSKKISTVTYHDSLGDFTLFAVASRSRDTAGRGDVVAFHGTGMSGVSDVLFGTHASLDVVDVSPTEVDARVPADADAGSVDVVLSGDGGSVDSGTMTIAVPSISGLSAADAQPGAEIVISGSYLATASSVTFSGTSATATPTSATDSAVHVVVPDTAEQGPVTVHTSYGSAVSADSIVIDPRVDSFSPSSGPAGTTVAITGGGFAGVTSVDFNTVAADSFSVVDATHITAVVPDDTSSTGQIKVTRAAVVSPALLAFTSPSPLSFTFTYVHSNGLGQTWQDTTAPGTYTLAEASQAAAAWDPNGSQSVVTCGGEDTVEMVSQDGAQIAYWVYGAGTLQGHAASANWQSAACPTATDPTWN